jgi:alkanesulfonate monooxygenase SsuD/methylene tetrahydromethanopterin reductase-like flavin-dependent oxidoreductase (luciferase family)
MEFGVIDHVDQQDRPIHETFDSRLALIQRYDEAGFYAFHCTEHHFTPLGLAPSPNVFLAAAARITTRIRLAPLVLILPLYNPLRVAAEICMLDHLTHGRYELGLGRGVSPYEMAFYNFNHLETQSIYREAYEVLIAALTRDSVEYDGRYFRYFNVPMQLKPYQRPHPPLWFPTSSPGGAAWAARNRMSTVFLRPAAQSRVFVDAYRDAWEDEHGDSGLPMPRVGLTRHIYVADTDAQAIERGMFGFRGWYDAFNYLWQKYDPRPLKIDPELQRAAGAIIMGTPASVRAQIEEQIQASGVNYFVLRFAFGNLTHAESLRSLELFVNEVMPHFR